MKECRMKGLSVSRSLLPLALALFAAGCSEAGAPPTGVQQPLAATPHFVRWTGGSPQFTAVGAPSGGVVNGLSLASASSMLSLDHYTASFWAVRGEQRSVQINYADSAGGTDSPFLRLVVVDPAYVPDQGDLAPGDSVLITVTVDTANIGVSLEPTGLQFGDPAQLQIWYGGAHGDLNGDGAVDSTDAAIEARLLSMWYREGSDSAWTQVPATHAVLDQSFTSELLHFCWYELAYDTYAVSW